MPDESLDPERAVTIVGGGFSGTILAAELARRGISAWLIEGGGRAGRGTAYSTPEPVHLLNVPAHNMSAFADDSSHFLRHFEAAGGDADGFAERRFYGDYLSAILDEAVCSGLIRPLAGEAVAASFSSGEWRISLSSGEVVRSKALAIAIGNEAPGGLAALDGFGQRYVANPWGEDARAAVAKAASEGGEVLIIGTGLTMVDTVLSLGEAGFAGRITALSRRGLAPRVHAGFEPAPVEPYEIPLGSPRALLRWLRRRSGKTGWRAAIDSLRPHSHFVWQSFSPDQQRRFLRHARPWWDVHRHRIAPQIGERIAGQIADGRLTVVAGRLVGARDGGEAIEVAIARRGKSALDNRRFSFVINCTGPLHGISRTPNSLLRSLLRQGLARPDALDIGLEVDDSARVESSERLWALGALTKGRYWEIIAVPDIRGQAADIARQIVEELDQ